MHGARRWIGLALALAGAVAAFAAIVPAAQADFTTGKCLGSNVTGRGASFANAAHTAWETNFQNSFCADVGVFPDLTYDPAGSGAGRRVMGERTAPNADGSLSRNQVPRYGMTDEPPTPTAVSQMNQGTDAVGDEGTIHVIPGAVGSVVLAVNWPDNCDRALLPDSAETNPAAANADPFTDRVRFTRTQAEEIWNGDSAHDEWDEIFPTLAADADCTGFITRVVRFDDSGTIVRVQGLARQGQPGARLGPGLHVRPRHAQLAERGARAASGLQPDDPAHGAARGAPDQRLLERQRLADGEAERHRRLGRLLRHRDRPLERPRHHADQRSGVA